LNYIVSVHTIIIIIIIIIIIMHTFLYHCKVVTSEAIVKVDTARYFKL